MPLMLASLRYEPLIPIAYQVQHASLDVGVCGVEGDGLEEIHRTHSRTLLQLPVFHCAREKILHRMRSGPGRRKIAPNFCLLYLPNPREDEVVPKDTAKDVEKQPGIAPVKQCRMSWCSERTKSTPQVLWKVIGTRRDAFHACTSAHERHLHMCEQQTPEN